MPIGLSTAVVMLFLFFWNVDISHFSDYSMTSGIIPFGRWVATILAILYPIAQILITRKISFAYTSVLLCIILVPSVVISYPEILRSVACFCLFGIVASHESQRNGTISALGYFVCAITVLSVPFVDLSSISSTLLTFGSDTFVRIRSSGIAQGPNNLGVISVVSFCFAQQLRSGRTIQKILWLALSSASVSCCLASGSRSGLIAMGFAIILTIYSGGIIAVLRYQKRWKHSTVVLALVLCGMSSIPLVLTLTGLIHSSGELQNSFAESNDARILLWLQSISDFSSRPLTGIGYAAPFDLGFDPVTFDPQSAPFAHNALLTYMRDSGVLGMAYFLFTLSLVATLITRWFRGGACTVVANYNNTRWLMLVGTISAVMIFSVIDGGLQNLHGINGIFAVCLGAIYRPASPSGLRLRQEYG